MSVFSQQLNIALEHAPYGTASRIADEEGLSSRSRLSEWRKGQGMPTPEQLVMLADRLNVRLEWLLAARGPMRPTKPGVRAEAYERIVGIVMETERPTPREPLPTRLSEIERHGLEVLGEDERGIDGNEGPGADEPPPPEAEPEGPA